MAKEKEICILFLWVNFSSDIYLAFGFGFTTKQLCTGKEQTVSMLWQQSIKELTLLPTERFWLLVPFQRWYSSSNFSVVLTEDCCVSLLYCVNSEIMIYSFQISWLFIKKIVSGSAVYLIPLRDFILFFFSKKLCTLPFQNNLSVFSSYFLQIWHKCIKIFWISSVIRNTGLEGNSQLISNMMQKVLELHLKTLEFLWCH